ncbi:MAG: hypothetical protein EOO15_14895 [Chitinophagaceae bacterium]|nr:MAG: hypothetical protein EOO15_14895 [Chitinophagaceae bacterium]
MRRHFRFFLLSLLLTALAAGGSAAYRSTTVPATAEQELVLRSKKQPVHPAHLSVAQQALSPAQHNQRGFAPPADLLPASAPVVAFQKAIGLPAFASLDASHKRYLAHNYPYHAFW